MKKIFSLLLTVATTLAITTSCADIPMPYDIFANGDVSYGKKLPYKNASLSAFSTYDKKEGLPAWSIGANYTQATSQTRKLSLISSLQHSTQLVQAVRFASLSTRQSVTRTT